MTVTSEIPVATPSLDPHVSIAEFLESTTARCGLILQPDGLGSQDFASDHNQWLQSAFKRELDLGQRVVNNLLTALDGTPVECMDDKGVRMSGKIMECAGFDLQTGNWKLVLVNAKTKAMSTGQRKAVVIVDLKPGEFLESYQRTQAQAA